MSTLLNKIKAAHSRVFRRFYIKRRLASSGLFESSWVEVSDDVEQWGRIRREIDNIRYSKIRFNDLITTFDNTDGKYNPEDAGNSRWYGYGSQQRTLVKIEAGFLHQTQSAGLIWTNTYLPTTSSVFFGIVSGDIFLTSQNRVQFPIRPLLQVFRDYPARNLTGFTSTGLTASQFMTMIRDQTDGSGSFIFRPFFADTTTQWNISTTSAVYSNLNTSTAKDVYDANVWDIMEKLAEAEDKVVYVSNAGVFNFTARDPNTTAAAFHFVGAGFNNTEYGHTIKGIQKYGKKQSDYYSRVEVKWLESNTLTSVLATQSSFIVSGSNTPWANGHRTYRFENLWIPDQTTAGTILNNVFANVSSLKDQIEFTSTFVPHLEILDRIKISYDSGNGSGNDRWDIYNWSADSGSNTSDLYWSKDAGDAIFLVNTEFKMNAIELDLDRLETKITGVKI